MRHAVVALCFVVGMTDNGASKDLRSFAYPSSANDGFELVRDRTNYQIPTERHGHRLCEYYDPEERERCTLAAQQCRRRISSRQQKSPALARTIHPYASLALGKKQTQ